jgi:hypothetical protein
MERTASERQGLAEMSRLLTTQTDCLAWRNEVPLIDLSIGVLERIVFITYF